MSTKKAIILLAAGNSSRLGSPKQLLEVEGKKLLEHATQAACLSTADDVFVVLGAEQEVLKKLITPFHVHLVFNQEWNKGMGNSIKAGLKTCLTVHAYEEIIISVCDQPHLTSNIFNQLIAYDKNFEIVASAYSDKNFGPPTLFRRTQIEKLLDIKDSSGAKSLIKKFNGALGLVPFPKGEIDLDTQEDYLNYLDSTKK